MNVVGSFKRQASGVIESFDHLAEAVFDRDAPVVTMFSGGLDSSYLLFKLRELGFRRVHAVFADVGEPGDTAQLEQTAAAFGAHFIHLDARQTFMEQGVTPAIRAHAKYLGNYPLSSSLSRPVIANIVAEFATAAGANLLLHTANLSQNSLPRLNNSIQRHGFAGAYGSPYVGSIISRHQKAAALAPYGLSFVTDRKLSGDENLWCREFEAGPLDDPELFAIPEDVFRWTRKTEYLPAEEVVLGFDDGNLTSVNGNQIALIDAIAFLNRSVGKFGHGRFVGLEHLKTDDKVLEVREAPAAAIIMDGLRHLEVASLSTGSLILKQGLEQTWAQEAVSGRWGSTSHTMCDVAIKAALEGVSGTVSYIIDETRFLPKSIIAETPRYVRDRDLWECRFATARSILTEAKFV